MTHPCARSLSLGGAGAIEALVSVCGWVYTCIEGDDDRTREMETSRVELLDFGSVTLYVVYG